MATYVKILMPDRPEDIVHLLGVIVGKHEQKGNQSPIAPSMGDRAIEHFQEVSFIVNRIKAIRNELSLLVQRRDNLMGLQGSVRKTGTTNHLMAQLRESLMAAYKGEERELVLWGYKVVLTDIPSSRFTSKTEDPPERDDGITEEGPTAENEDLDHDSNASEEDDDLDIGIGEEGVN